jgi:hypothetical protein
MIKGMPDGFLETLERITNVSGLYREAWWLISRFEEPVWEIRFEGTSFFINWNVRFGEGFLTDARYSDIRNTFKTYLIVQTHPVTVGGRPIGDRAARPAVRQACRIVDYFLLNQKELQLPKYGLLSVTENDVSILLYRFERDPSDSEAVYDWTARLSTRLDDRLCHLESDAKRLVEKHEALSDFATPREDWTLSADQGRVALWRAVLWIDGFYKHPKSAAFRYVVSSSKLSEELYAETLLGRGRKPSIPELNLYPTDAYKREYPGVEVRTGEGEGPGPSYLRVRCRAVGAMVHVASAGFEVPLDAFENAKNYKPVEPERMAKAGRFRNPPFWQVMDGIKDGVRFCADHGSDLLDSYYNILVAAKEEKASYYVLLRRHDIREFLTPGAKALGIEHWCLRMRSGAFYIGAGYKHARDPEHWSMEKFYDEFRKGRGLLQNLRVFYGSITHVIGPLTARRQSELTGLPVSGALDESGEFILFDNAKSGALGLREKEARPIPPVIKTQVAQVAAFHNKLVNAGVLEKTGFLFSVPGVRGLRVPSVLTFNECLDAFCDFFETPLDEGGRRHYLREHQFRRFFIIAFFFSARTRNLDTLRWFIAHTDAQHLWHYLTNLVSGDLYREVAAYFLADELRLPEEERVVEIHETAHERLTSHLESQFGTKKFSLVDAETLELYLQSQIDSGLVVEPEFFPFAVDFPYKIVVKLKGAR